MPNVEHSELTQDGMHAIFTRMGYDFDTSGTIYNGNVTINQAALNRQGFMPILTGVGPRRDSGHWIMLIKGKDNNYYLFDPLGKASGESYKAAIADKLPRGANLAVIPNRSGLNMGLCGYWVASAGLRAHAALNEDAPDLESVGQTISDEMSNELDAGGYYKITGWLNAVRDNFPGDAPSDPVNATELRRATEKDLVPTVPSPVIIPKISTPDVSSTKTTSLPDWSEFSLFSNGDVLDAINYVHREYLGKPYPGPLKNPEDPSEGRLAPSEGPDRTPHGLSHTVRTMACAEMMVEEARKAKLRGETLKEARNKQTLADVTPEELKKILIAQAFFVVGRDDERSGMDRSGRNFYAEYHKKSEDAFRKYVTHNNLIGTVFKDQKEVDYYADIILDKDLDWDATPAHVLINQGHMVDLMRVKAPAEVALELAYEALKKSVGSQGAEAILKAHRAFFLATGAVVPSVNPEAIDDPSRGGPYEDPYNGSKYVIVDEKVPATKKALTKVDRNYVLKDNERYLTIKEYYAFADVQKEYPGYKTRVEGSSYYFPTAFSAECERNPARCIGALQQVRSGIQLDTLKNSLQSSSDKARRGPTTDEKAAALIIQKIMANPDAIQDDHVLLNGQKLDEQFFRTLMANCDMAIVGTLLNDTDVSNIDNFMQHEKDTPFHSTEEGAVPKNLGQEWSKLRSRYSSVSQLKNDLIYLMQNDAWYHTRINAITQNRDRGSTFKEVLTAALMTPLTTKALADTNTVKNPPKKLYRALTLDDAFTNRLLNQAKNVMASTSDGLFTDNSAELFKQIKINDFSKMSANTCLSTSENIEVPKLFGGNVIFEMVDPDGLLDPKQVGAHGEGTENEFSFYLPDDVALIPTQVRIDPDKAGDGRERYVFTLVAVKSPDFTPTIEEGYATKPFMAIESEKAKNIIRTVQNDIPANTLADLGTLIDDRHNGLRNYIHRPIRGTGFLDKFSRAFSSGDDGKISQERQNFLSKNVLPALESCKVALRENDIAKLEKALKRLPSDSAWNPYLPEEGLLFKNSIDQLKIEMEKRILFEREIIPALENCEDALSKENGIEALTMIHMLPEESEMNSRPIFNTVKNELLNFKKELMEGLSEIAPAPVLREEEKVQSRYEKLLEAATHRVDTIEKEKVKNFGDYQKLAKDLNYLYSELTLLNAEKVRLHSKNPDEPIDKSDINLLKARVDAVTEKAVDKLSNDLEATLAKLTNPEAFHTHKDKIMHTIALLDTLDKNLDDTQDIRKQKIQTLKESFINKEKIYPNLVELNLKQEALIMQLRTLSNVQKLTTDRVVAPKTGFLANFGMFGRAVDEFVNPKEYQVIKEKNSRILNMNEILNSKKVNGEIVIRHLASKKPAELEEGLGISAKEALALKDVFEQIDKKSDNAKGLEELSTLLDTMVSKMVQKPEIPSIRQEAVIDDKFRPNF